MTAHSKSATHPAKAKTTTRNSQDKLIHLPPPLRPLIHPNGNTPPRHHKLPKSLPIHHHPPRTPPQQIRPHLPRMLPPHKHPLPSTLPPIRHQHRQPVPAAPRGIPEAREPHAVRRVKVVVLRPVGPALPREHHLGDDGAAAGRGGVGRVLGVGVRAEGAVEVGPEDAGEAGVGAEEEEGVGEGDEEGGDGGLVRGVSERRNWVEGWGTYLEGLAGLGVVVDDKGLGLSVWKRERKRRSLPRRCLVSRVPGHRRISLSDPPFPPATRCG